MAYEAGGNGIQSSMTQNLWVHVAVSIQLWETVSMKGFESIKWQACCRWHNPADGDMGGTGKGRGTSVQRSLIRSFRANPDP